MKGIYNKRPSLPRYSMTWDVNEVLKHLETLHLDDINLKDLSMKCVTLLALLSGQRIQTIQGLNINCMVFTHDGCEIFIDKVLKTSKPGNHKSFLSFKSYSNINLCIVSHLKRYTQKTEHLRNNEENVFISYQKPHKLVSTDTIARWIKNILKMSNIDIKSFGAHSTRAASMSKAATIGVPVDEILCAAGWTNAETFAKFYNKPIVSNTICYNILDNFKQ
jgi:integrase